MQKSCTWCGRIHPYSEICPMKPKKFKDIYSEDGKRIHRFRNSKAWKQVRENVLERDFYLCQVCMQEKCLNSEHLEVHHIVPLTVDWEQRLEEDNLISLCRFHHEKAESGEIGADVLRALIKKE